MPERNMGEEMQQGGWRRHDPLLSCLIEVARMHDRGLSPEAFLAGLPLPDGRLIPSVFRRAASRAGLVSRISKRSLSAVRKELFPVILLLQEDDACVLLDVDFDRQVAKVFFSESGQGEAEIGLTELGEHYSGYCIFIRPRFRFDDRAPAVRPIVGRHWFWGTIFANLALYKKVMAAAVLINIFAIVLPFFTLNVYDRVVPNNAFETMWSLAAGTFIVLGADFYLRMLRGQLIDLASKRVDISLSTLIMERVLGMKLADRPASVGAFAANLRAFESVRDFITSTTITAFVDLPFALLFLAAIAWISPALSLPVILLMCLLISYAFILQPKMQELSEMTYRATATRNSTLVEALVGLETVKTQCAEGSIQRKWENSVVYLAKVGMELRTCSLKIMNCSATVQQSMVVLIVIVGVYLISDRQLSLGGLIAVIMLSSRALAPFGQIAGLITQYQNALTGLASLNSVVTKPVERPEEATFVRRGRLHGEIEFDSVSFSYPNTSSEILRDVSFKIKQGEHVVVIGKVGSGKSTLNRLLLGLYQPTKGAVRIDGVDLRQLDPAELRMSMGYVPQDVVLFYGSLRDNITFGMHYVEDEAIIQSAEISGLLPMIGNHPDGFDLAISERGENLSGGQRQAVAIARAVIHQPSILLFDEPSSAMDYSTEEAFKEKMRTFATGKTMLIVTHRSSLMDLASRIIVVDRGRVVMDGPKEKVIRSLQAGQVGQGGKDES